MTEWNSRERLLAALEYRNPDKIPVIYQESPAGLYMHGKKLLDLFNELKPDNAIVFKNLPLPMSGTVDNQGNYHQVRIDEWGTTLENTRFGILGSAQGFPLNSWADQKNYNLPVPPAPSGPEFEARKKEIAEQAKTHLIIDGWISLYERLCAIRPTEDVLCDLFAENADLLALLDRMTEYWRKVIEFQIATGIDAVYFGDDWGSQSNQLISTELFRKIFKPRYERLMQPLRDAGKKIFFHSCGNLGGILPELLDLNIDLLWPQIQLYNFENLTAQCRAKQTALCVQLDRQKIIPYGSPSDIEAMVKTCSAFFHKAGGGGVFWVEIEDDSPWANVKALITSIHQYR